MSEVTTQIDIDVPPEEVWDFIMDTSCLDDWVTIHRKLGDVSDRELKPGSTVEQTMCLRGVNFKVHWEVKQYDRPNEAVWEGRGPARSKALIRDKLEPNGNGGTRFTYTNEFHPPGGPLGAVASRVVIGGVPQREADASLQQLKQILERRKKS